MRGSALNRHTVLRLISGTPPLLSGLVDLEEQLQPNGIDLTVGSVAAFTSAGRIGATNHDRVLSATADLESDAEGYFHLSPGPYLVTFNEVVTLPRDVMALGRPRSSLLRCGAAVHSAVWDAGYSGRSQTLVVVYNPSGFRLARNARLMQLVFFSLDEEVAGYAGVYQNENV